MRVNFAFLFILTALILSGLFIFHLHKTGQFGVFNGERKLIEPAIRETAIEASSAEFVDSDDRAENQITTSESSRSSNGEMSESDAKLESPSTDRRKGEIKFDIEKKVELDNNGKSVEYGEFVVDADLPRNKTVKVHYGIALDEDGNPKPVSDNFVFFAPYFPERGFIKKDEFRWYPETPGYTIFSMDIVSDLSEVEDRAKIYYYKESGFHDLVFKVQGILEKKFNLRHKKLLITGQSAGATMAEQLACYYSDKIDAIAVSGGHRYDFPKAGNTVAWLMTHATGDLVRLKEQRKLNEHMAGVGLQMLHTIMPPIYKNVTGRYFHHTASKANWRLLQSFITGIVELRDANGGSVPPLGEWPETYVLDGRIEHLPSKKFAELWRSIPHESIAKLNRDRGNGNPVYFVPKERVPKGVVVYIHDPSLNPGIQLLDCLFFIMDSGRVAATVRMGDNYLSTLRNIEKLLVEVRRKAEWKGLPIYVFGAGNAGQLAAVAALRKGETIEKKRIVRHIGKGEITKTKYIHHSRIKKITVVDTSYTWPFPRLSIRRARGRCKSHIPLVMLYDSDYEQPLPKNGGYRRVRRVSAKGISLEKKWCKVLNKSFDGE